MVHRRDAKNAKGKTEGKKLGIWKFETEFLQLPGFQPLLFLCDLCVLCGDLNLGWEGAESRKTRKPGDLFEHDFMNFISEGEGET